MAIEENRTVKLKLKVDTSEIRSLLEKLDSHEHIPGKDEFISSFIQRVRSCELTSEEAMRIKAVVDGRVRKPEPKNHNYGNTPFGGIVQCRECMKIIHPPDAASDLSECPGSPA